MKKKITSIVLALIIIMSVAAPAFAASVTDFTDVLAGAWYYDYVRIACDEGLISGTSATTFSPGTTMTRGQFVTVLGRYAGVSTSAVQNTGKFADVAADQYYTPYIYWASEQGIVYGTSDSTFAPDADITKEQMATLLYRYAESAGLTIPASGGNNITFGDAASISSYARESVESLKNAGIITGNDNGNFQPQKSISRAEATTMLVKFIALYDTGEDTDPNFIDCNTIYATILDDDGYATSQMYLGDTRQISVTYVPENTTIDKTCTYVSGDTSILTVSSTGLVTGVSVGESYVTVTSSNGVSAVCRITIKSKSTQLTSFELAWGDVWSIGTYTGGDGVGYYEYEWTMMGETSTVTREIGDNSGYMLLSPQLVYSDGNTQIILPESYSAYKLSFTSSNPSLVSISADSSIIVHRAIGPTEGPQTVTITVRSDYFETSQAATITLYHKG